MVAIEIVKRGNEALTLNPPTGLDIHITSHGSDWYFSAMSLMGFTAIVAYAWGRFSRKDHERLFHYALVFSLFTLSIAYYTMGSDLGWTGIQAEFNHDTVSNSIDSPGIRQIFYARYVGWFLAFPPLILSLAVLNNVPWATTVFVALTWEVWIVNLLIGSLIHSTYKWGYFVFGVVSYVVGSYSLVGSFHKSGVENTLIDSTAMRTHLITSISTVFLTGLYFIAWGLSDGGNVIQPDSEAAFFGALDVVLFVLVGFFFLWGVRNVDFKQVGIDYSDRSFFHNGRHSGESMKEEPMTVPPATTMAADTTAPAAAPQPAEV
jgi:bacteriorhodopsin